MEYHRNSFHAKLHGAEMSPLEDILGVSSEEDSAFDPETDAKLERMALENLERDRERVGRQRNN